MKVQNKRLGYHLNVEVVKAKPIFMQLFLPLIIRRNFIIRYSSLEKYTLLYKSISMESRSITLKERTIKRIEVLGAGGKGGSGREECGWRVGVLLWFFSISVQ